MLERSMEALPSRELTCPTLGRGTSSNIILGGDILVLLEGTPVLWWISSCDPGFWRKPIALLDDKVGHAVQGIILDDVNRSISHL